MNVRFDPIEHKYWNELGVSMPSVTWILAESGLCDFSFVQEEVRARAMARGKSVHWMLQLEDQGKLDYRRVPIRLRPFRKAYLDWKRNSGFMPTVIEEPFISPFGFAGTPDRIGKLPPTALYPIGSKAVVDFKTGGVQDWTRFQLAAYSTNGHANVSLAKTFRRIALALKADGTYQVKEFPTSSWDSDFSTFMEARRTTDARHASLSTAV